MQTGRTFGTRWGLGFVLLTLILSQFIYANEPAPAGTGLLREKWNNIFGGKVSSLTSSQKFPNFPDEHSYLTEGFQGPTNIGSNYGTRVRGYIVPTTTGTYNLLISGDDQTYLYLSTDSTSANKVLVASVPRWSARLQWDRYASQKSAPLNLVAGQKYYVEMLQVEGTGGDHFAAGWQIDGGEIQVIPAANLQPLTDAEAPSTPVLEVQHVSDQLVRLKLTANDDVGIKNFQLYRDGALLGTIATSNYTDADVAPTTTYQYTAIAVDHSGKTSPESAAVNATTTATPAVGSGTGLTGCYFNDMEFAERVLVRTDATIDFMWRYGSPATGVDPQTYSVIWVGEIEAQYTESLTIHVESDDGKRVFFGASRELMIDDWRLHGMREHSFTVPVVAGKRYPIRIQYFQKHGGAGCKLRWSGLSFAKRIIPSSQLYPSPWEEGTDVGIRTAAASITSPAFVEGRVGVDATDVEATVCMDTGSKRPPKLIAVTRLHATAWFTNVRLNPNHAIDFSVTAGSNTVTQALVWTPTDIATTTDDIKVRVGDSLLLTCQGDGETVEIDVDHDSEKGFITDHIGGPKDKFVQKFDTPGVFTVEAQIDGVSAGSITVIVVGVDLQGPIACEIGYKREKTVSVEGGNADDVSFAAADGELMHCSVKEVTLDGATLYLKPFRSSTPKLLARLGDENGPIITIHDVDEFTMATQATKFITIDEQFEDGSFLVKTNMEMYPKVDDLEVRLHIFVSGVTFEDSTLDLTLDTTNFTLDEESGLYLHSYRMIMIPKRKGGPCHTIKVYQNNVQVGGK